MQDSAELHPIAGEEAARLAAASSENGHDDHHEIATTKPKVHYSDLGLTPDNLLEMYYYMLLARSLDERMWLLNRQGKIAFVISCQGQEGAQVGLAYALEKGKDFACPYYRDLGMMVTLGQTPRDVMLSVFGRAENTDSGGRQMPGHFGHRKLNVPTGSSPIATQNVHAAGVALGFKLRGIDGVAITSIGEGGTSQGDWHEAMNFAATQSLPMIMMVENNRYAISEPQEKQMHIRNVADRAAAYGCPGVVVDGNDILDVYRASIEAVRRARAGEGPTLIEAKVNRFTPHSSDDDDKRYRDPNEVKLARSQQDPVTLLHDLLISENILNDKMDEQIRARIMTEVDDATEYALTAANPKPEDLYTYVYADHTEATVESQYENIGE